MASSFPYHYVGPGSAVTTLTAETIADLAASLASIANLNIYAPATGSTIDVFKGDDFSANPITVTKAGGETHWPATLSTVHAWVRPKANTLVEDTAAQGMPLIVTVSPVPLSGFAASGGSLPIGHGLTTGVYAVFGANQHEVNGYFTVTIGASATWNMLSTATVATATGTVKIQAGIACTITSATGSAQAFTFGPTTAQTQRLSAAVANGYDFWFVANAVTVPRELRAGTLNSRRSPTGT